MGAELRERFRGRNACTGRVPGAVENACAIGLREFREFLGLPVGDAGEVAEDFVDRIRLHAWHHVGDGALKASGHRLIELVIGREHRNALGYAKAAHFEVRCAALQTQRFGFLRERNDAAVVVAQDHNGLFAKFGTENTLCAAIEGITVNMH